MKRSNHSGYTNFDGSPDLAPDAESTIQFGFERSAQPNSDTARAMSNLSPEQWMYLASGVILTLSGIVRRGPIGLLMSVLGGGLLYQAITGINPLQLLRNLDTDTDTDSDSPFPGTPAAAMRRDSRHSTPTPASLNIEN